MTKFSVPKIGEEVGSWTVESDPVRRDRYYFLLCRCSCGEQKEVRLDSLMRGESKRCRHQMKINPGDRFGAWTVLAEVDPKHGGKNRYFRCQCACGRISEVGISSLKYGESLSCQSCKALKHGFARDSVGHAAEYAVWSAMKQRCTNPNLKNYKDYGGRKITYDPRWERFEAFMEDMGPRPSSNHSLDRLDNDDNYYKANCEWRLPQQQANNRRTCRWIEFNGKRQSISDWSRETGISIGTLSYRLNTGQPKDKVFDPTLQKSGRPTNVERLQRAEAGRVPTARVACVREGDLTRAQWDEIKQQHGNRCFYCKQVFERLTQDHIVAITKGGAHTASNVVPACRVCNSRKGNRPL